MRGITTPTTMTHGLMSNWLVYSVISCTRNVLGRIFLCCVLGSHLPVQYFREFSSAMFQGVIFLCSVLGSHLPLLGSHLPLQCFGESSSFAMFQGVLILCNVSGSPHPLQCFKDSSSFAMFQGVLFLCNVSENSSPLQCFREPPPSVGETSRQAAIRAYTSTSFTCTHTIWWWRCPTCA